MKDFFKNKYVMLAEAALLFIVAFILVASGNYTKSDELIDSLIKAAIGIIGGIDGIGTVIAAFRKDKETTDEAD